MIARKKSLRDYCRDKALRTAKEAPLSKTAPMSGTWPQARNGALQRSRKPMRRQSAKAKALIPARRACQAVVRARSGGRCEVRIEGQCIGYATDVHEILARGAGGSITDPENCLNSCRPCHDFVTEHPNRARELGFVAPRGT